jgi:hypothetical protein
LMLLTYLLQSIIFVFGRHDGNVLRKARTSTVEDMHHWQIQKRSVLHPKFDELQRSNSLEDFDANAEQNVKTEKERKPKRAMEKK